ncbi:hypothetical protein [Algoriphagus aquimarinus]|uniref:Uncharacterized protein n=1 Tax=Algoriphagus aquimarinus TaxID=237018 RepID=A0A5C7B1U4_9BACT|nr:hypothetical protein [Algoriphagus aquimarinus]TXE13739.1 hypothetical protein ESV85_07180 [Algoriphagus aquimarinus]
MDFLFRTPLLTFDPRNQEDIEKNWEQIIQAITYSSPDFALAIKGKKYSNLTKHQQEKLQSDAVFNIKYQIDVSSCQSFEIPEEDVLTAII